MADVGSRSPGATGEPFATHDEPSLTEPDDPDHTAAPQPATSPAPPATKPQFDIPRHSAMNVASVDVRSPERRVLIGGTEITAARDIEIRAEAVGPSYCDIRLWNIDARRWERIGPQDEIEVQLGWDGTEPETVFRGTVGIKRRPTRRGDSAFLLRGASREMATLKNRYTQTFNDLPPHRIAEFVAREVGFDVGYISTRSESTGSYWSLSTHRELRHWFDRLAEEANAATREPWTWYIDRGRFYFHPIDEQVTEPVALSMDHSLISGSPIGEQQQPGVHPHELTMYCEPVIRRGLTVTVDGVGTIPPEAKYRVQSYVFESSTTEGYHHTYATIERLGERNDQYGN